MDWSIGSISGELGLDISPFTKGMFTAIETAKMFPGIIGEFMANPLLGAADLIKVGFEDIKKSIEIGIDVTKEYADAIKEIAVANAEAGEMAGSLGLSVETYTNLSAAARLVGADSMALGESIKFLNRNMADAAQGNKDLYREFLQLGVSVVDASGHLRDTQDVFFDTADALAALPNAAMRTRYAMDLLGRSADEMLPFLSRGSAGIKQLMQEEARFGVTTSKDASEAGDKFRHLKVDWDLMWEGIEKRATEPAIDLIAKNFGKIQDAMGGFSDKAAKGINLVFGWIIDHQGDITAAFHMAGVAASKAMKLIASEAPAAKIEVRKLLDEGKGWKDYVVANWPAISANLKEIKLDAEACGSSLKAAGTVGLHAWEGIMHAIEGTEDAIGRLMVAQANAQHNAELNGKINKDFSFMGYVNHFENWAVPALHHLSPMLAPLPPGYTDTGSAMPPPVYRGGSSHSSNSAPVNVHVTVDPAATANAVAKAILPVMQDAIKKAKGAANSQVRQAAQRNGL